MGHKPIKLCKSTRIINVRSSLHINNPVTVKLPIYDHQRFHLRTVRFRHASKHHNSRNAIPRRFHAIPSASASDSASETRNAPPPAIPCNVGEECVVDKNIRRNVKSKETLRDLIVNCSFKGVRGRRALSHKLGFGSD